MDDDVLTLLITGILVALCACVICFVWVCALDDEVRRLRQETNRVEDRMAYVMATLRTYELEPSIQEATRRDKK